MFGKTYGEAYLLQWEPVVNERSERHLAMEDSAMIDKIGRAQDLAANDDRAGAYAIYNVLWAEATRAGDQYQACIVAHFLAHAHVEPEAQLAWHLRALQAADAVGDERVRSFYPSLHANLGDVYLRLGNLPQAQEHIDKARKFEHILPDDGYGRLIRSLIIRLTQTIERDNSRG
jgi:tetratricopeptide (TPR) repeat protein